MRPPGVTRSMSNASERGSRSNAYKDGERWQVHNDKAMGLIETAAKEGGRDQPPHCKQKERPPTARFYQGDDAQAEQGQIEGR